MLAEYATVVEPSDDDDYRITKQALCWDYNNRRTWCTQIKNVCKKLNISHVFFNQLSVDMKNFENKLSEYSKNIWNEGLPVYPKLKTYITF